MIALHDPNNATVRPLRQQIEVQTGEEVDLLIADTRFNLATQIAKASVKERAKISRTLSDKIDRWVLGSWTGIPLF